MIKLSDQTKERKDLAKKLKDDASPRNMRVLSTIIHVKEYQSILYQAYYPNERFTKNCRNFLTFIQKPS